MMIGELEYDDLMHSTDETLVNENGTLSIESELQDQYYRISVHFLMLLFIVLFSIIIMNLLFGLAVTDVQVRKKGTQ